MLNMMMITIATIGIIRAIGIASQIGIAGTIRNCRHQHERHPQREDRRAGDRLLRLLMVRSAGRVPRRV